MMYGTNCTVLDSTLINYYARAHLSLNTYYISYWTIIQYYHVYILHALLFILSLVDPFHRYSSDPRCNVVVVVVSHIQRIGCQPEKTTLHGGQSRSWSAEQGKENKRKSLAAYPPPHPPHCSFGENK